MVKISKDGDSPNYLLDEKAAKKFIKQMLKNHTFIGNFVEQRYVPQFDCYKKIVKISNNEDIFIENLIIAKTRIDKFFGSSKWVGITCPKTSGAPVGYNLWVEIDEEILGTYVFCVKDVFFTENQISLKLLVLGPHNERTSFRNSILKYSHENISSKCSDIEEVEKPEEKIFAWANIKKGSIFMFLLITAIVTGGMQLLMFLMDYILKLLREFSNIIRVATPIFIACFDTISRMFGYICFLIALLWRERHGPQKPPNVYTRRLNYQPAYPYENRYKALPYKSRSSVTITELDN